MHQINNAATYRCASKSTGNIEASLSSFTALNNIDNDSDDGNNESGTNGIEVQPNQHNPEDAAPQRDFHELIQGAFELESRLITCLEKNMNRNEDREMSQTSHEISALRHELATLQLAYNTKVTEAQAKAIDQVASYAIELEDFKHKVHEMFGKLERHVEVELDGLDSGLIAFVEENRQDIEEKMIKMTNRLRREMAAIYKKEKQESREDVVADVKKSHVPPTSPPFGVVFFMFGAWVALVCSASLFLSVLMTETGST